jgi:predicted amidohydrolase
MVNLVLHCGARHVERRAVEEANTPAPSETWLPIAHQMHPAINRSVYRAGAEAPVFTVGNVTFGVLICRDSLFPEPARLMLSRGAQVLLVPTNNGMPRVKGGSEIVIEARTCDIGRALESGVPVVRADVAGLDGGFASYGSSSVVNRDGRVLGTARALVADLVVADIDIREIQHKYCLRGAVPDED